VVLSQRILLTTQFLSTFFNKTAFYIKYWQFFKWANYRVEKGSKGEWNENIEVRGITQDIEWNNCTC